LLTEQNTPKSNSKSNNFRISVDAMKDYSAHYKFIKKSGLLFGREVPRSKFKVGYEGWIQWRNQFTPRQGEDISLVENAVKSLHDQRQLNDEDYARLKKLYGLSAETVAQPVNQGAPAPKIELRVPEPPRAEAAAQANVVCPSCGVAARPGAKFCVSCGVSFKPAKSTMAVPGAPPRFCRRCGAKATEGAKFCKQCGNPFTETRPVEIERRTKFCTQCGAKLAEEVKFCEMCGKPVET
jgi:hypothetical protein